jgi:hypothetical protein
MMKLTFNNLTRTETNQLVIGNLQRKGWTVVVSPTIPEYDLDTQKLIEDNLTKEYSVVDLSPEELQEQADAQALIDAQILESQQRQAIYDQIDAGYLVEPEGFTLGLTESDRNAFTQMLTLTQEALSLGMVDNDTNQTIADKSGVKHSITTLRFRQIMIGYGMYFKGLWDSINN